MQFTHNARPRLPVRRACLRTEAMPDGSALVFDPVVNRAFALTSSAALAWELCDGCHDAAGMAARIADRFDVGARQAERDVTTLLDQLIALGLVDGTPIEVL